MSEITVPAISSEVTYQIVASSAGPFVVPFPFTKQEDIRARKRDDVTGFETDLFLTTDFTFSLLNAPSQQEGIGFDDGEITLNSSLENHTLKIFRDTVIDRLTNYPSTGPFSIYLLNNEFAKIYTILQELEAQKQKYMTLPDSALDTTAWDVSGRALCNISESEDDDCAATNRQVDASGPNWLNDDDLETAVGPTDQWNPIITESSIKIQGKVVGDPATEKTFDLLSHFYTTLQNRSGAEASFYLRYQYQVDCYSAITKIGNSSFPIRIAPSSSIPFSFMDIAQDIDYFNGDCTLSVSLDIYPLGPNSGNMYAESKNLSVNTSEPR